MNSRVSWSVDGIDPSVRERAEAAARRAGMSLNDWLNSTVGEAIPPNFREPYGQPQGHQGHFAQEARAVDDIHQRLDAITRQIEQIAKPSPRQDAPRGEARSAPAVARQLNDAISRLDARLSQISNPAPRQTQQDKQRQAEMVERAAAQVYRPSPPLSPASFDSAIAEIAARQNELDAPLPPPRRPIPSRNAPPVQQYAPQPAPQYTPPPQMPAYAPPPMAAPAPPPPAPGPDFSALERHLIKITSQIESLQRPDHIEQSIAAFRNELAEIRHAITEAMPRRAIESIENEIRSLHRRIDESRQNGTDGQALASIERALSDIREVLRTLTPAEQLAGYDDAIRNLGAKLDLILRANDDPSTVHQLEGAIAALRSIVSNVASNDALARLSDDVQMLSSKVDQIGRTGGNSDAFAMLEQRIAALASSIETRERPAPSNTEYIENALQALSERIDRLPVGNDNTSAIAHLEQRVSYLIERIEASTDSHANSNNNLGRVEDALQDILRHLERQHANLASLADTSRHFSAAPVQPQMDPAIVDMVKRELSDIRFSQSETDRRTQDSLETVHSTLGHVVDRLAMIEGDLRAVRAAPVAAPAPPPTAPAFVPPAAAAFVPPPAPVIAEAPVEAPRAAMPLPPKPELPNPAASQAFAQGNIQAAAPAPKEHFVAAPRNFGAVEPAAATPPPIPPRAISDILIPHSAAAARAAIEPDLPPDHPLEPGTRPTARASSSTERIAASEDALSEIPKGPKEPVSTSSFIAAARRAAQAAAANAANEKTARAAPKKTAADKAKEKAKAKIEAKVEAKAAAAKAADDKEPSTITSKIRSLLVGASVVVIVLGTFKMAMTLLDTGTAPPMPAMEEPAAAPAPAAKDSNAAPASPAPAAPSMITSPTPIGRQSNHTPAPNLLDSAQVPIPPAQVPAAPAPASDVTGAIPATPPAPAAMTTPGKIGVVQVPPSEQLPEGIAGPKLRAAVMKGDAAAAYEIGTRFAEGKGVAVNLDEAAKWYDRAAQAGLIPAIFRLGTFYEKGLSVKRDPEIARRYYTQAAERGNAKAMHNLAVLDADGGGKGANYKSAAQWFRKAADRGVADSQFNLGILYARGIGVDQNLAESFKWFSLAAAQGDADSARKRDDVAKRLDPQSLAAAKLAIQTFTPEPQPEDSVNVAVPAGGWDSAPTQASAAKPAAKPARRAAAPATTTAR
ncbi:SEL1-like repeat protein [Bradyrhizobium lablabi]|uniref:tetratricopeptide repeat protein n=1 Tax=Bradyrhizobium lablabi TaxID=722472 RepID=UPI001BA4FE5B|nr:tetratricopeptide repeat protein [Bradyrhizobium lablabi]MBR1121697.1 SEL1-like repeat protein [Bradyrhizobium lablabi]